MVRARASAVRLHLQRSAKTGGDETKSRDSQPTILSCALSWCNLLLGPIPNCPLDSVSVLLKTRWGCLLCSSNACAASKFRLRLACNGHRCACQRMNVATGLDKTNFLRRRPPEGEGHVTANSIVTAHLFPLLSNAVQSRRRRRRLCRCSMINHPWLERRRVEQRSIKDVVSVGIQDLSFD